MVDIRAMAALKPGAAGFRLFALYERCGRNDEHFVGF
jgi:hypothetical protein